MEPRLYFIAHPPELSDDKFRRSGRVGGIVETDMHRVPTLPVKSGQFSFAPPQTVIT